MLGGFTPLLLNVGAEPQSMFPTALVGPLVAALNELWLLGMEPAVEEFIAWQGRLTHSALKSDYSSPDLPVDVLPLGALLVVHILDEPVEVEVPVSHMLNDDLSVEVNEDLGIRTHHPGILLVSIQLPTVDTSVQET